MGEATMPVTGGCLCGAVRYETTERPHRVGYCHCRMCQKASGAPVVVGVYFRLEAFRFTHGEPKLYKSSDIARRAFCANCGSRLIYEPLDSDSIAVEVGSLDNPEDAQPTYHTGVESRLPWLSLQDDLPCKRTDDGIPFAEFSNPAHEHIQPNSGTAVDLATAVAGGCLCGEIGYQVTGGQLRGTVCHCRTCRKISGAPFLTWAIFKPEQFKWIVGAPVSFRWSPEVIRKFCGNCGSPLSFQFDAAYSDQIVGTTTGTLDRPADFPPTRHNWTSRQLPWISFADGLPSHPHNAGDETEA